MLLLSLFVSEEATEESAVGKLNIYSFINSWSSDFNKRKL